MTEKRTAYTVSHKPVPDNFESAVIGVFKKLVEATHRGAKKHDCCERCLTQQVLLNWLLNSHVFCHSGHQETFLLAVENLARELRMGTFNPNTFPLAAPDTAPGELH